MHLHMHSHKGTSSKNALWFAYLLLNVSLFVYRRWWTTLSPRCVVFRSYCLPGCAATSTFATWSVVRRHCSCFSSCSLPCRQRRAIPTTEKGYALFPLSLLRRKVMLYPYYGERLFIVPCIPTTEKGYSLFPLSLLRRKVMHYSLYSYYGERLCIVPCIPLPWRCFVSSSTNSYFWLLPHVALCIS